MKGVHEGRATALDWATFAVMLLLVIMLSVSEYRRGVAEGSRDILLAIMTPVEPVYVEPARRPAQYRPMEPARGGNR